MTKVDCFRPKMTFFDPKTNKITFFDPEMTLIGLILRQKLLFSENQHVEFMNSSSGNQDRSAVFYRNGNCSKEYLKCKDRTPWPNTMYKWSEQSYSGKWVSRGEDDNTNCLKTLTTSQIQTCLKNGVIAVNGDSIGRQIFHALNMTLRGIKAGFVDHGQPDLVEFLKIGQTSLYYSWSDGDKKTLLRMNEKVENQYKLPNIFELKKLKILILGPKLVHPLSHWNTPFENSLKRAFWFFEEFTLPKILKLVTENSKVGVYLLAQHYVHRSNDTFQYEKFTDLYNDWMKKRIFEIGNSRVNFVSVTTELGLTPDKSTIIAVDGTHWMWTKRKFRAFEEGLPVSPNHEGLLNVVFNHYCR